MKIGIHNEPLGGGLGGSEVCVAVLAGALAKNHEVEIVHHRAAMTLESLSQFTGVDLHNVTLRVSPPLPGPQRPELNFWRRYRAEREEQAALSRDYDVFITFTHGLPPYCAAPAGVLMVLFPLFDFNGFIALAGNNSPSALASFQRRLRTSLHKWKWRSCLRGYQVKVAISDFTRRWTKQRWNIDCQINFPPVNVDIQPGEKMNRILSVGRFTVYGHGKKQVEMLQTFSRLKAAGHSDWHYDCAGGCGTSEEDQAFLGKVKQLGAECQAGIIANISPVQLKGLYQHAKIFWHAAGMDEDERARPELTEHFGITTVEAMAAGCVPVVINKGGQPEIVEHGVSGFLWNTPEEWQRYTVLLMQDDALCQKMSKAARDRAQMFSREAFVRRFDSLLAPCLKPKGKY